MYIAATVSGLLFTLFRVNVPVVPHVLSHWSFGMLAPFQSYLENNEDLVALGRHTGGVWEAIDMDPYFPHRKGEQSIRIYLPEHRKLGEAVLSDKYTEFAQMILNLEAADGRTWDELQLKLEAWPRSPGGYEFLREDVFIRTTPLVSLP